MDKRGKFIVIDGMDGSGKGTQIAMLQEKLKGHPVIFTREPGGSPRAEEIRRMILTQSGTPSNAVCDFFLFWAARGSHIEDIVAPARASGKHVICDRYDSSTFAFQIHGETTMPWLKDLFLHMRTKLPDTYVPDLYIVLDLDPAVAHGRRRNDMTQEKSKFDVKDLEYHGRVRHGFKTFAEVHPRVLFVDAHRTPEEIHTDVWRIVSETITQ